MSTATLIAGEPFDLLVRLFGFLRVRRKPSGWCDVSATVPFDPGESVARALQSIATEIRTDPERRTPEALRADAFVELVQRISEETRRVHTA